MAQGPNYGLQGGSQWIVSDEGTLTIGAGGTLNVESGGVINVASGGSFIGNGVSLTAPVFNVITLGGTVGKWAFGTTTLTSGVGTLGFPGFTRVMGVTANVILGEASGLGSPTSVHTDYTLAGAGSVIFRAVAGTLGYAANVNIGYSGFGT
jgi:hypothetical protein